MRIGIFFLMGMILFGCRYFGGDKNISIPSPKGYYLAEPKKIFLSESLDEISGIVFKSDSEIVAENDEEGKIFIVNPNKSKQPQSWNCAKPGDFEDIVFTGSEWYLLRSDGIVYLLNNPFTDSCAHQKFPSPFTESEFEGLYYDEGRKSLMMVCKSCSMDNEKKFVSVFAFDVTTKTWKTEPAFQIEVKSIAQQANKDKLHFKPSAAAINPADKNLYIVSSVNKLLVVADVNGEVKEVFDLPIADFKQPEGISFAPNGDMYISNEALDGTPTILLFKYNGKQ